jgi:hypothetical protein
MKITIEHYDKTAYIEVPDDSDLDDFQETITKILGLIWLPEQVDEIMRVHDYEEGYKSAMNTVEPSPIRRPVQVEQARDALGKIKSNPF